MTAPFTQGSQICVSIGFSIIANASDQPRDVEDAVPYSVDWRFALTKTIAQTIHPSPLEKVSSGTDDGRGRFTHKLSASSTSSVTHFVRATFPIGEGMDLCVSFDFPITANSRYQPRAADDRPYGVDWQVCAVYLAPSGRELSTKLTEGECGAQTLNQQRRRGVSPPENVPRTNPPTKKGPKPLSLRSLPFYMISRCIATSCLRDDTPSLL